MIGDNGKIRKIAANYIFLPGYSLTKNGYVVLGGTGAITVINTGGQFKEIAGLEFYGGMIVPDYVSEYLSVFRAGEKMLPFLEQLFAEKGNICQKVAIVEGADLKSLTWRNEATIRLL